MDYIYDIYTIKDENKIIFHIFKINKKNEIKREIEEINYFLYISKKDYENLNLKNKILKKYQNFKKEEVYKIEFGNKKEYINLTNKLKELDLPTYEKDLPYDLYYLIEKNISLDCNFLPFREAYIDIETKKDGTVIMVSLFSKNKKVIFVNTTKKIKDSKNYEIKKFENELDLLLEFQNILIKENYNILLGWNVIEFDFNILNKRFKKYGISLKLNSFKEYKFKIRINKDFFKESTAEYPGTLIIDAIYLLKTNSIKFENYKLETVAQKVLGEGKTIKFEEKDINNKYEVLNKLYEENIDKLIEYNFMDSKLVYEIVKKLDLLRLTFEKTKITSNLIKKVKYPILNLDVLYLKKLHERGIVANTHYNFKDTKQIIGGFVLEPVKGFHKNVLVFDFKSIYPSIIMTFNIDPLTYSEEGDIVAPNNARFIREKGILPEIIEKLFNEREKAKKENNKIKSYSLKILMNSFYGAIASPKSRYYNRNIGEAITTFGHMFIKEIKKFFQNKGLEVIYGDTDSIFVKVENKNLERTGKELEKKANEYLKRLIKERYNLKSKIKLEFETAFKILFLASKKRYVGKKIDNEIKFVGLEAVRGDWTELSKKFQREFIEMIFNESEIKDIKEFIKKYVKDLKDGKYDKYLFYKKKISKELDKYTKTTPPHVKAAREKKDFKNRVVEYIITKEGPKLKELFFKNNYKIDYEHYIEKQLKPVIEDFLNYLNLDFNEINTGEKQEGLSKFF